MYLAGRLRSIREAKQLSQGDIERRTGLLRCYISRVENGHTVPAIETLEKISRALEVPLYQLFYDGEEPPLEPRVFNNGQEDWATHGKGKRLFTKLCRSLSLTNEVDRSLLLHLAKKMAQAKRKGNRKVTSARA
jgi:transcriptional regulator with XRE-family HTH domain